MTELTHHDAEDGFHEIQLSGKQLIFAFMLTATVAVFIFLLGVQVGRNAKTTARADETPESTTSQSPSGTPAAGQPLPPPPPDAAPAGESPAPPDKLSYPERLGAENQVAEKLKPKAIADSPEAAPASHGRSAPPPAPAAKEAVKEAVKEAPKPSPADSHPVPAKSAAPSGERPGVWVVQLVALKDRSAANSVVQRLSAKGYPAFVVSPSAGAPSIYRVQVGRYNDRREAEQVARRLEKEEQFKPWISH